MSIGIDDNGASAAEIATIKGDIRLLASEMSTGMNSVSKQLDGLQQQMAVMSSLTAEVARHQMTMESQSAGLQRAFDAIESHHDDYLSWRDSHCAENDKTAKSVVRFGGVLFGFAAVIGLLTAAVITIANQWVTTAANDRARIEAMASKELNKLDSKIENNRNDFDARLDQLEKQR